MIDCCYLRNPNFNTSISIELETAHTIGGRTFGVKNNCVQFFGLSLFTGVQKAFFCTNSCYFSNINLKMRFFLECVDDATWRNKYNKTCAHYNKQWCENGGPKENSTWTFGEKYGFPEKHCCSCGKSRS